MTTVEACVAKEAWTTLCRIGDTSVAVEPEAVTGIYAVHLTINMGLVTGPGYTITHRPSGWAVWHVREFAAAIRVARWLDESGVLPLTAADAMSWKEKLTPLERARMHMQLAAIAPREHVVS